MSNSATVILAPFVVAFLVFVFRFYTREGASSIANPTFLLAIVTVIFAFAFLGLGVFGMLPAYGTIAFGILGVALMILAIVRMFQL